MRKQLGYIGLGKMGSAMVMRLLEKGWAVETYDSSGKGTAKSIESLVLNVETPRVLWLMVPHAAVDQVIEQLDLSRGDIVIDGGNSFYEESIRRAKHLKRKGILFADVGVSGGPGGARDGACLMIGGEKAVYKKLTPLFQDIAVENGYAYMGKSGAGHFVKMVHNGIEYGMMQSMAEGFAIMKKSSFSLNLQEVARVYNHGSVVESRLMEWLGQGLKNINKASGSVGHTGEGEWTVKTAKKLGVPVPIIKASFQFRVESAKKPSYAGKILTVMRNQFGGHRLK